jgi:hypothetical protein
MRATVRKCKSGTVLRGIWLWTQHKSYRILFFFPTIIYTPLYDKRFRSYDSLKSTGLLKFCLDWIDRLEQSELLNPIRTQSRETFNTNIIANLLGFPTFNCMHHFEQHNKSYSHQNTADQRRFQRKAGNRFSFGARINIGSVTELKEQICYKFSRVPGPSQLRINLKFGSAVHWLHFP